MTRGLAAALVVLVAALVALGVTLAQHESARGAWEGARARLGEADYSAAESDRLYADVDALRDRTERLGGVTALALITAAWALGAATKRGAARTQPSRPLLLRASLADAGAVALGVVLTLGAQRVRLGSPAQSDLVALLVPALALAFLVALAARGHTPGTHRMRLELGWPPWRGLLVVLAMPLAPLALFGARGARLGRSAPHLLVAGVLDESAA